MGKRTAHATSPSRSRGARRLIAGLRITGQDEELLSLVRPFFPDADSEGDLAYRLWRRGLEITLAELVSVGVALPAGVAEDYIATLVAQRIALCLPLLQRSGRLALLGLDSALPPAIPLRLSSDEPADIDAAAAVTIVSLGGSDFL